MTSNRDAANTQPLLKTWRWLKYAASWLWLPRSRPADESTRALNDWSATQLDDVFSTLRPLMRVHTALFHGHPDSPLLAVPKFIWDGQEETHDAFEQRLIRFAKECPASIGLVEMTFDLHVWIHIELKQAPVRRWVNEAANVDLDFKSHNPYGALSMNHTLFREESSTGESNAELHRLNNPLLKEALKKIETRLGTIAEVEGLPDVTRTGFETIE